MESSKENLYNDAEAQRLEDLTSLLKGYEVIG